MSANGHRAAWILPESVLLEKRGLGNKRAETSPAQGNRAQHMTHSAPAPAFSSAPTVEIYFLPGGQVVHERPCSEREGGVTALCPFLTPPPASRQLYRLLHLLPLGCCAREQTYRQGPPGSGETSSMTAMSSFMVGYSDSPQGPSISYQMTLPPFILVPGAGESLPT